MNSGLWSFYLQRLVSFSAINTFKGFTKGQRSPSIFLTNQNATPFCFLRACLQTGHLTQTCAILRSLSVIFRVTDFTVTFLFHLFPSSDFTDRTVIRSYQHNFLSPIHHFFQFPAHPKKRHSLWFHRRLFSCFWVSSHISIIFLHSKTPESPDINSSIIFKFIRKTVEHDINYLCRLFISQVFLLCQHFDQI